MSCFRLKLTLATPIALNAPLTLDALLSAAISNATGLIGEATAPHIPLEQTHGVYRGSALFLHPRYRHEVVGRVMALRGERDVAMRLFRPNGRQYVSVYTDKAKKYANKLSAYPGYRSQEVFFFGAGDGEQAAYLISNFIPGIGKRANGGAGEILSVAVTELDNDYSWRLPDGSPARPLPIERWQEIGGDPSSPVMPLAVTFPYWDAQKVQAVFPTRLTI